jgi:putative DNA primase/helicase
VHVAGLIPGRRFVFADNDASRAGETAAIATGLPYVMAPRPDGQKTMDANDLHQSEGVIALAKLIMDARSR